MASNSSLIILRYELGFAVGFSRHPTCFLRLAERDGDSLFLRVPGVNQLTNIGLHRLLR